MNAILAYCVQYNLNPCDVLFVSDIPGDIKHGKNAGVQTMGFTGGITERESSLRAAGADHCINRLLEILEKFG